VIDSHTGRKARIWEPSFGESSYEYWVKYGDRGVGKAVFKEI
jgi:hypothetical protein